MVAANVSGNDCIVFYPEKHNYSNQIYYVCLNKTLVSKYPLSIYPLFYSAINL